VTVESCREECAVSSAHRPPDARSPLVFDVHDLRGAGMMKPIRRSAPAPADFGTDVIGVPPGSPIDLDLRLEAVVEGVLVSGTARALALGECVRCLDPVEMSVEAELQELFAYPDRIEMDPASEDEVSLLSDDLLDLEPVLRDQVVLDLPFQPLCRPECRGLCPLCGARLNDEPDHQHTDADPRWAALTGWDDDPAAPTQTENSVSESLGDAQDRKE